jgi:hypothetical protein
MLFLTPVLARCQDGFPASLQMYAMPFFVISVAAIFILENVLFVQGDLPRALHPVNYWVK